MAHVVGVPRRDPCRKCQLPVFLAERLLVGKKVYHRTCLKCARCGSQLTPGSFYETEVDEQYVCETCPDEEITTDGGDFVTANSGARENVGTAATSEDETSPVQMRNHHLEGESGFATASSSSTRTVRSSIRDRLAFFEKQQQQPDPLDRDSKLLQKSLSDEEKSKSLQRMEKPSGTTPSTSGGYKMNSALSNFLNDTVDYEPDNDTETDPDRDEDESESLSSSIQNSKMETSDSEETDDLTSVSLPPELPKSLPPPFMVAEQQPQQQEEKKKEEPNKRYTASAQLILGSDATTSSTATTSTTRELHADQEENIIRTSTPIQATTELEISVTSTKKTTDKTNNNDVEQKPSSPKDPETIMAPKLADTKETIQQIELENNLACKETNDNDCVTKDKATVDASIVAMETTTEAAQQFESTTEPATVTTEKTPIEVTSSSISPKSRESSVEKELETSENHENVELRTKSPTEDRIESSIPMTVEDKETTQRLSVVRARLQQFEVITNNEKDNESTKIATTATTNTKEHPEEKQLNKTQTVTSTSPTLENESQSRSEQEIEIVIPTPAPREETLKMNTETVAEVSEKVQASSQEEQKELLTEKEILTKKEDEVPLKMETKDNEILEDKIKSIEEQEEQQPTEEKQEDNSTQLKETPKEEEHPTVPSKDSSTPHQTPSKIPLEEYPEDLNPFKSDDEDDNEHQAGEENKENVELRKPSTQKVNLNPFDSSDDEIELEKSQNTSTSTPKIPPPRPPPPRISKNPFGSEDEDDEENAPAQLRRSSLTASQIRRTPVPTPRSNVSQSLNPTPEATPRLSTKANLVNSSNNSHLQHNAANTAAAAATSHNNSSFVLQNSSDFYGSNNSLHSHHNLSSGTTPNNNLLRNSDIRSSNNSLNLSAGGTIRSRKTRRAPLPPAPVKELFPSSETINTSSKASTPSSSTVGTPKSGRKKRPAPAPPKPARLEPNSVPQIQIDTITTQPKNLHSYPLQSELDSKLSDEEKALLEGKTIQSQLNHNSTDLSPATTRRSSKRLIPLDQDLLEEHATNESQCDDLKHQQQNQKSYLHDQSEPNVVYRRLLIPHNLDTPTHESNPLLDELNNSSNSSIMTGERQLEKLKDNKEANNRNRQSQISAASSGAEDNDPLFNKSVHGKWKRRKGPAPALPIPPRRVLQMLPLQEIKHELDIIEVQQQGLEKQGVILEKMIRDRCEGENGELLNAAGEIATTDGENSKEVEGLILQLFELVNEKNELFRRQAELMYLRRQHRLEQEQADLEYEIRVLMAQPECNKTDSDKAREEAFIERLLEVVKLRNEVVECLEMDRLREAEEDQSIKQRLESHIASKRDDEPEKQKSSSTTKLSKKEKKKQKESKKLAKNKKLDADKDADESELSLDKQKTKKKKKLLIF